MTVSLDAPQRKQIERRRQQTRDYRLAMRLSTVLWRDDGKTETEIAHLLSICTRTVRHWLRLYRTKGLDALCTLHYRGDPGELTASQAEHLRAEIQTGRFRCARQVREWLQATFAVAYSLSGTKRLLQRLGCSLTLGASAHVRGVSHSDPERDANSFRLDAVSQIAVKSIITGNC